MVVVCGLLQAYIVILMARIILSWFPIAPESGMAAIYGFLYAITEPVLGPIRRVIPPIGGGGFGLDLSPMIVFFVIILLTQSLC